MNKQKNNPYLEFFPFSQRERGYNSKKGFTLVELIVVITILAILGTIAFISLQGYSSQSRDSVRISDISRMKTGLELFNLDAGKYPLPSDETIITYSGAIAWTQGYFGEETVTNVDKLDKVPTDPLTDKKYVYSTTSTRNEYQLAGVMEGDEVTQNRFPLPPLLKGDKANAAEKTARLKISGNYNGKVLKTSTGSTSCVLAVPSIITSSGTTLETIVQNKLLAYNGYKNLPFQYNGTYKALGEDSLNLVNSSSLEVYCGDLKTLSDTTSTGTLVRKTLIQNLQSAYSGTTIKNVGEINSILQTNITDTNATENISISIISNNLGGSIVASSSSSSGGGGPTPLITQTTCTSAGWIWVSSANDVYIGSTQSTSGFCISPRFGDWQTNGTDLMDGAGGISFNGWGNSTSTYYNGWNTSGIGDTGNSASDFAQTRKLDSEVSYNCKTLGTAGSDYDTSDTVVGRMKWLATTGNTYTQARSIDWITGLAPHTVGTYPHAIPALYIADCIDGVKDLGTTMTYTHNNNTQSSISYASYNVDAATAVNSIALSNTTFQNRQKYLTAWTQKSGSHLPSAFSYITSGYASASDSDGNFLTGSDRGEYQVACDAGIFGAVTWSTNQYIGASDDIDDELIWLSAISPANGSNWGSETRVVNSTGCGYQNSTSTGNHGGTVAARFVVRP